MGIDFCALIKCPQISGMDDPRVVQLENDRPREVSEVGDMWRSQPSASVSYASGPVWTRCDEIAADPLPRPKELDLSVCLSTPEQFTFLFGTGSVMVYHRLRFWKFVERSEWRAVMIRAASALVEHFRGTEAILTPDDSPILGAFQDGVPFDEAVAKGVGVDREVPSIEGFSVPKEEAPEGSFGYHGYWRLR